MTQSNQMEIKKSWWANLLHPDDKDLPWLKFKYLYDFLGDKKWKLLEVWCSSWKNLRSIKEYYDDFELYWVDVDEDAINIWKKNFKEINFVVWSWDKLPFSDEEFDIIVISDYLEHVNDSDKSLREIYRVLKKWWYVHAFIPCEWEKWSVYWIFKKIFWFNIKKTWWHVQFFTKKEIEKYLTNIWFQILEKKYSYHTLWQLMNFSLYTLLLNDKIAKIWWEKNKYYNIESEAKSTLVSRIFNRILSIWNFIAYLESSIQKNVSIFSMWMHLIIKK
jgi:ubiquinone/menaquinone biosynthesis C-methylase UbiE